MKLFAVLGDPIAHSLSPLMHNFVYRQNAIEAIYARARVADGKRLREVFETLGLSGANITVPHKESAFELCDEVRGIAARLGAVNTWVKEGDRIAGYNTDAEGFAASIAPLNGVKSALVLGAGGAARSIALALIESGADTAVVNRSAARLEFFKPLGARVFDWQNLPRERFDLVVNSTSAGLKEDDLPLEKEALKAYLTGAKTAYDAIYGRQTPFLRLALECGAAVKDGEDMLAFQGAIAHTLFFGGGDRAKIAETMKTALRLPASWRQSPPREG
ncbi:MAG: shikimate dehydrogenase [Helicobacteraceae bacterium]|jgi:shikimate dehydrogenase|nr:shikimate dehydrogenase [Helicobacteraceae bacterium]